MRLDAHPAPSLGPFPPEQSVRWGEAASDSASGQGGLSGSASVSLIKVDRWCCCLISDCCIM